MLTARHPIKCHPDRTYRATPNPRRAADVASYSAITSIIGVSHVEGMLTGRGRAKIAPDPWEQTCCGEVSGG